MVFTLETVKVLFSFFSQFSFIVHIANSIIINIWISFMVLFDRGIAIKTFNVGF